MRQLRPATYLFLSSLCCLPAVSSQAATIADTQQLRAILQIEVHVKREDGVGTCGSQPFGVDHIDGGNFTCHPPKYWFGYSLVANMTRNDLRLIPQGDGSWSVTGEGSTVHGTGHYRELSHWSDDQRVCSPTSIRPLSKFFAFAADGTVNNQNITLKITTIPEEVSTWQCRNGHGYERKTSLLLQNWAMAMEIPPKRTLEITLTPKERTASGTYRLQLAKSMNPSPQDRDFTTVDIQLKCINPQVNSPASSWEEDTVPCPWETN